MDIGPNNQEEIVFSYGCYFKAHISRYSTSHGPWTHLWNDKVTEVQRRSMEFDQDLVASDLGNGFLIERQAVKAILFVVDDPLLRRSGSHFVVQVYRI